MLDPLNVLLVLPWLSPPCNGPVSGIVCVGVWDDLVVMNANAGLSPRGFHPLLSVCARRIPAEEKRQRC